MEVGEERTRRAVAWIGVAVLGTLVAGVVYLRPSLAPPTGAAPSAPAHVAVPASGWRLVSASFGDANHGAVQLSSGPAPTTTFLTSDGGKTWQMAARAPRNGYAWAGFIDTRTVVAQTVTSLGPVNASPVTTRISYDAGRTWRRLADPRVSAGLGLPGFLDSEHAWWIDRPPSPDPRTLVALWRTTDGGRSWQELVTSGLTASGFPREPVFTDPLHGALVFTSADRSTSVLATDDGGETWRTVKAFEVPQGTRVLSWVILRRGKRLLSWLVTMPDTTLTAGVGQLSPPGTVIDYMPFASFSDDGGQTWSQPLAGPNVVQPGYVGLNPTVDDHGRLLLVDDRRLWISHDGGATWAARLMQAPAELRPTTLVNAVPGALFATAAQTGPVGVPGTALTLIRSADDGAHWSPVNVPRSPAPAVA